jgi:3-methyladenine DNA glycosylase/8-oxoguanine DNA glycosylase
MMTEQRQRGFDLVAARAHLQRRDRRLARWLDRIETLLPNPGWQQPFDPVDALARSICYQQLSGKAAATIVGRLENTIGGTQLHAAALDRFDDESLRTCGLSRNKLLALRDLAEHERRGEIPSVADMGTMDDHAIIDALVKVRGIGRWTVEMLLIFRLGRPDVLPLADLGVRKGLAVIDGQDAVPTPAELAERGARWAPWRSYASLALWKIADLGSGAVAPVKRSQD